jgi:hypothetical protein
MIARAVQLACATAREHAHMHSRRYRVIVNNQSQPLFTMEGTVVSGKSIVGGSGGQ